MQQENADCHSVLDPTSTKSTKWSQCGIHKPKVKGTKRHNLCIYMWPMRQGLHRQSIILRSSHQSELHEVLCQNETRIQKPYSITCGKGRKEGGNCQKGKEKEMTMKLLIH